MIGKRIKYCKTEFGIGTVTDFDGTTLTILFDNRKKKGEELKFDYCLMKERNLIEFIW